jgi:Tol biopolymer transport system component
VRTDGQGYRQIADAQFAEVGEWSPDGSQLLYVRWKSLEESEGLWVAKWDGSLPRQLVPHLERPGTWSPDGRWIAYAGNDQAPGLWLLNVATLERQQVVPQPVSWVQWVRAGPGIFYLQGEAGQADLWLLRAKDRQRQQLTTSGNVAEAVASPTGQQVAVVVSRESRGDKDFFGREDTYILTLKGEAAP